MPDAAEPGRTTAAMDTGLAAGRRWGEDPPVAP
jgi:hypothetical protein